MTSGRSITVRALSRYSEMTAVVALHRRIFTRPEPYSAEMLLAVERAGGLVLGGFVGREMVCLSVALRAVGPEGEYLFGKATGVLRGHRDLGLGRLVKLAQREFCLKAGLGHMRWVFSPLVARTAHFHLTSIGAVCRSYDPLYHQSTEGRSGPFAVNDRLVATWEVSTERVASRLSGERPSSLEGAWATRVEVEDGLPRLADTYPELSEPRLLVEIPHDLYAYSSSPEVLIPWREGVGRLLDKYVNGEGYEVTECVGPVVEGLRRPFYLLERRA